VKAHVNRNKRVVKQTGDLVKDFHQVLMPMRKPHDDKFNDKKKFLESRRYN